METFITKSPDYTLILDTLKADSEMSAIFGENFFYTAPLMPIEGDEGLAPYFYIAPVVNSGELRSSDGGVMRQNDNINLVVVSGPVLSSTQCDWLVRTAYQLICNTFVGLTCGTVKILSCTKVDESPVMFDETHDVKTKKLLLSISYSEA